MADGYLKFVNAPFGRWLAGTTGLPRPLPLTRYSAGGSALVTPLILGGTAAGRMNAAVRHVFDSTGTESAMVASTDAPSNRQLQGAVFDATGITDTYQLDEVYRFFHANVRRLGHGGRVLVLGTPPECCDSLPFAVAQRALEGLTRSLGKELRKAITVQLVCVEPGAEQSVESTLRFFLSNRSAYVSGQVVRVGTAIENPAESFDWSMPLAGRHALVTGASRGIGAAIAEVLAREGAHVICLDVAQAESALQQVGQATRGSCLSLDITAADAGEQLLQESKKRGGFDIVVHNAGITRDKTIARMSPLQWRDVMAVNLEAPLQLSQTLLAGGGLGRGARIVCVSSISGIAGNLGQTNYAASKAGVIGLVEQLAPRAAAQDVTVNAVAPGFIETGMTAKVPMMIREAGRRMNSMSQGGLPVDVAETVAWLAHPASGGINGQIVRVCGQSLLGSMSTMHAAATQIIDSIPTRRQMFIDGLRSLRKHPPPTTPALPDHVLVRPEATLDADEIAAYAEVCGFDRAQGVPLTFPHVLAFPLHMLLLTAPDFPYPAVGMVHLSNSITQRKPLMRGQSLRIEVRCSRWLAHTKGQALAIETQACHGGESVWHSESVYLSRREHSPIGEFYHDSLAPDLQRLVQLERWQLNADLGRRYARVSGDHNPIHVSRVGARLFGFKRTIAHGMWTKARALAGVLPSRALATAHVAVSFKTPAFLPGEVLLQIDPQISGKRFAVRCAQDARPHLYGHLHGVSIA